MSAIFISYRQADAGAQARLVWDRLSSRLGDRHVFLAEASIEAGRAWQAEIDRQLDDCAVMVVVAGNGWMRHGEASLGDPDDWVGYEVRTAICRGITVVPILVGGASKPEPEQLPVEFRPLLARQWKEVDASSRSSIDTILPTLLDHMPPLVRRAFKRRPKRGSATKPSADDDVRISVDAADPPTHIAPLHDISGFGAVPDHVVPESRRSCLGALDRLLPERAWGFAVVSGPLSIGCTALISRWWQERSHCYASFDIVMSIQAAEVATRVAGDAQGWPVMEHEILARLRQWQASAPGAPLATIDDYLVGRRALLVIDGLPIDWVNAHGQRGDVGIRAFVRRMLEPYSRGHPPEDQILHLLLGVRTHGFEHAAVDAGIRLPAGPRSGARPPSEIRLGRISDDEARAVLSGTSADHLSPAEVTQCLRLCGGYFRLLEWIRAEAASRPPGSNRIDDLLSDARALTANGRSHALLDDLALQGASYAFLRMLAIADGYLEDTELQGLYEHLDDHAFVVDRLETHARAEYFQKGPPVFTDRSSDGSGARVTLLPMVRSLLVEDLLQITAGKRPRGVGGPAGNMPDEVRSAQYAAEIKAIRIAIARHHFRSIRHRLGLPGSPLAGAAARVVLEPGDLKRILRCVTLLMGARDVVVARRVDGGPERAPWAASRRLPDAANAKRAAVSTGPAAWTEGRVTAVFQLPATGALTGRAFAADAELTAFVHEVLVLPLERCATIHDHAALDALHALLCRFLGGDLRRAPAGVDGRAHAHLLRWIGATRIARGDLQGADECLEVALDRGRDAVRDATGDEAVAAEALLAHVACTHATALIRLGRVEPAAALVAAILAGTPRLAAAALAVAGPARPPADDAAFGAWLRLRERQAQVEVLRGALEVALPLFAECTSLLRRVARPDGPEPAGVRRRNGARDDGPHLAGEAGRAYSRALIRAGALAFGDADYRTAECDRCLEEARRLIEWNIHHGAERDRAIFHIELAVVLRALSDHAGAREALRDARAWLEAREPSASATLELAIEECRQEVFELHVHGKPCPAALVERARKVRDECRARDHRLLAINASIVLASAARTRRADPELREIEREIRQTGLGFRAPDIEALLKGTFDPVYVLFA